MKRELHRITSLQRFVYRLQRRFAVVDFSLWMSCGIDRLKGLDAETDSSFAMRIIGSEELLLLLTCNPNAQIESFCQLDRERFTCFGVFCDDKIIAYAWVGTGLIPAEHNCNGHPWTGLSFEPLPSYAYLFAAFVSEAFRGRRVYSAMLAGIAANIARGNTCELLLTVDANNRSAIRSVDRMGFRTIGVTRLFRFLCFQNASYHFSCDFGFIFLGSYVGDTKLKNERL